VTTPAPAGRLEATRRKGGNIADDSVPTGSTAGLVRRLAEGDRAAAEQLIEHSIDRLRRLARKMLRDEPRVRRWEETDDVVQAAALRLLRALREVTPDSPQGFITLAATMIRRELIDLARHHYGPEGEAAHHASVPAGAKSDSPPLYEGADRADGPLTQLEWQEFHEEVQKLPKEERSVFELIFYQGMEQAEVAEVLEVSVPTVKRRWRSARLLLHQATRAGAVDEGG